MVRASLVAQTVKNPETRRSPREGNGYPLQDSCLENAMDRGAWRAAVHGFAKGWDTTERARMHAKLLQSCLTLCDPMECSLPGSSVHRILQARILEWVAIPFSRGSSQPRGQTWVSCIAGRFLTHLSHQGSCNVYRQRQLK